MVVILVMSGTNRLFQLEIRSTDNQVHTTNYSYNGTGGDGAYAIYSSTPPGGAPASQGTFANCSFTPIVLGGEIVFFDGIQQNQTSVLKWAVSSERAISYHNILRSVDGVIWEQLTTVSSLGSSKSVNNYQAIDHFPFRGNNYYKLQLVDFDGKIEQERITLVKAKLSIFYNESTSTIQLVEASDVEIYTIEGKLVAKSFNENNISFNRSGIYLVRDVKNGTTTKIVVK